MKTIINAIESLVKNPELILKECYNKKNRANSNGDMLEEYIIDLFAGTLREEDDNERKNKIKEAFSYIGNDSTPPDAMLFGGDAIEVKKIESKAGTIQLNSSHPKQKLDSTDPMITEECRNAVDGKWSERDLIYIIGSLIENKLKSLFMIYGMDFAAPEKVYLNIANKIKGALEECGDLELAETRELGRLNKVDSLGITSLRVRGMWILENPWNTFSYVTVLNKYKKFEFCAIINAEKYSTFSLRDRTKLEELVNEVEQFSITDIKIKNPSDPDNDAARIPAKMFRFFID